MKARKIRTFTTEAEFAELCFFYPIGRYRLDKIAHPFGTIHDCSTSGFAYRIISMEML
jgi:hypothetical protein